MERNAARKFGPGEGGGKACRSVIIIVAQKQKKKNECHDDFNSDMYYHYKV